MGAVGRGGGKGLPPESKVTGRQPSGSASSMESRGILGAVLTAILPTGSPGMEKAGLLPGQQSLSLSTAPPQRCCS